MSFRSPYPGYDVLAKWDSPSFNAVTRQVLARRLAEPPPRRFLTESEWRLMEAVCARLVPQPDRASPVPITPWIDDMLAEGRGEGFRHAGTPPLQEAWRAGLAGLEDEARAREGAAFVELSPERQDALLRAVQKGETKARWAGAPAKHFFTHLLLKTVVGVYYAHPDAWSEIGFGGPASPRGYLRLKADRRDPWEARER